MARTVGQVLINAVLPDSHKISGPMNNKQLHDHVVDLAKTDPQLYVRTAMALKRRGDEIATLEGITVGLEDIRPEYATRDAILQPARKAFDAAKTTKEKHQIVVDTQEKLLAHTKQHGGSMTHMALSGARGNPAQLMKIVAAPLATVHPKRGVEPHLLDRSYSEGLTPAQYWLHGPEVRGNEVATRISVSEPGEIAKVLVSNMIGTVVTTHDCGTRTGVRLSTSDPHVLDRYAQENPGVPRNTVVTPRLAQDLQRRGVTSLLVRSPMTCAAPQGVCQLCQGLSEKGQPQGIGTPVGVRAAQAMAEPLTQMALSSKHGTLTVKAQTPELTGMKGVRQILEVPKAFRHEAVLANHTGTIQHIDRAPQGGHYVLVDKHSHYVAPELALKVTKGMSVEAGDILSEGVPHPAKIVEHKGLGAGRAYFVDALHRIYKDSGVTLDKRHLELLAKSEINHVQLQETDPEHPEFLKGDLINYNAFRDAYLHDAVDLSTSDAIGRRLGREVGHHTVGTLVTPHLAKALREEGHATLPVAKRMPPVNFVMKPFTMNPLLEKDWMARLAHRYLKSTLADAAATGESTDLHGTHPVPAWAVGAELRHGPGGTY